MKLFHRKQQSEAQTEADDLAEIAAIEEAAARAEAIADEGMAVMPEFGTRSCPKCGEDDARTDFVHAFINSDGTAKPVRPGFNMVGARGVLRRVCVECGFVRVERPLDYEEAS